jgi:hypothetical protein
MKGGMVAVLKSDLYFCKWLKNNYFLCTEESGLSDPYNQQTSRQTNIWYKAVVNSLLFKIVRKNILTYEI